MFPNVQQALAGFHQRALSERQLPVGTSTGPGQEASKRIATEDVRAVGALDRGQFALRTRCNHDCICTGTFDERSRNVASEFDLYAEWASAIIRGQPIQAPSRRYAAGIIALRPDRDGHITGYSGTQEIWSRYGDCIVADHFPEPGHPTPRRRHVDCENAQPAFY